jgi:1-acyl-sn-glycerol-3-phosphate acyltransferase
MEQISAAPSPGISWSTLWYDLMHVAGMAGFTLGFSFRFAGTRHMPKTGPALLVANHQSFVDPWIVGLAVKRHLTYLARKTLFKNRVFAGIIRSLNAVPIDQEGVGKEGIRAVVEQLRGGSAVLIFPEGSRTPDGFMHPFRPGIHLLIKRSLAPIVPVGIAGAYQAWPIWRKYPVPAPLFLPPAPGTIAVVIGPPLPSERFAALEREQAVAELGAAIQAVQSRAEELRRR